jgi:MFS family permease
VAGVLSLVVGFALFGAVVFLPLYFQTVDAASPAESGLRLLPMMAGVLVMSTLSGQLITRTGRYRVFPIVGTALMTCGLLLLSRLGVGTSTLAASLFLLVLGLGLGATMQVLVLAVQNAVDYAVLGVATSAVTMLRGIGGSLGTAVFGTIFASRLSAQLGGAAGAGTDLTGEQVARLPAAARAAYQEAYVHALRPVFLVAAGVAALGFALSWRLRERPLRETAASSLGLDDALAAPRSPDSLAEIERALARVTTLDDRRRFAERMTRRAELDVSPGAAWALVRIDEHGLAPARRMAEEDGVPPERIAAVLHELERRGLVAGDAITGAGRALADRAVEARRAELDAALRDGRSGRPPEVDALLRRLARALAGDRP